MGRLDYDDNVRPLAPDQSEQPETAQRGRPRATAALAAAAVFIVILVVFGSGTGEEQSDDDADSDFAAETADLSTTTTTMPPPLSASLPFETDGLIAVSRGEIPRTVVWPATDRFARSYPLVSTPTTAQFDAVGRAIAYIDTSWVLMAGPLPGDGAVRINSLASAAVFHPQNADELAYTASPNGTGTNGLYRIDVIASAIDSAASELVTPLGDDTRLLTWGDWGFAVAVDSPAAIVVLDPSGSPIRAMPGVGHKGGGDVMLVGAAASSIDAEELEALAPIVVGEDHAMAIVDHEFQPQFLFPGTGTEIPFVTISADGLRISVTTYTSADGVSITIRDRSDGSIRTVRLDATEVTWPIGFTSSGDHLAMQNGVGGQILLVDWRSGESYQVPGLSGEFVAVDI